MKGGPLQQQAEPGFVLNHNIYVLFFSITTFALVDLLLVQFRWENMLVLALIHVSERNYRRKNGIMKHKQLKSADSLMGGKHGCDLCCVNH